MDQWIDIDIQGYEQDLWYVERKMVDILLDQHRSLLLFIWKVKLMYGESAKTIITSKFEMMTLIEVFSALGLQVSVVKLQLAAEDPIPLLAAVGQR
jgi:hypothetical protein